MDQHLVRRATTVLLDERGAFRMTMDSSTERY